MSVTAALQDDLDFDLIVEDGVPVEKTVHLLAMMLFRHLARLRLRALAERCAADGGYVGADQFVYYSLEQAREVAEEERQLALFEQGMRPEKPKKSAFRGPDAFIVQGVSDHERDAWISWQEDDRLPDLILELLSPSTARMDYGEKKRLYQEVFRSSEYFIYQPRAETVEGYRLFDHRYQDIACEDSGRLWSGVLQAEVGVWHGEYDGLPGPWLRLFHPNGRLVLTSDERQRQEIEQERQAKEQERQAKEQGGGQERPRSSGPSKSGEARRPRSSWASKSGEARRPRSSGPSRSGRRKRPRSLRTHAFAP